ncbi:MAG: fibronectin type III domain-containing protein, partial [Halobacteriovoraceae bacterium]|nr:fibronectin type III domain-containing protein [Halobacteriovoraceae bacterium]
MRSFKLFLTFISMIFILAGCVGTVEEKNPKASKTGKIDEEQITFSGIIDALPVSDSKVLLSWLPAAGNQADLVYLVYINGADIPIEVNGAGLNPDYSGALNFTVGGLTVNTTYSFSVGVLDTKTGTETDNNKSLFATTFANFTADFSGISALYPAAGEAGKSEVIVEWVPATTLGTQFSPRSTDPIAYEIRYIKATDGGPTNLRNQGDPNVTVLRNPTTLTSSTQLSNERLRRVVGLAPGTKYFFLVRAIHKSFVAFGTQPGYKLEENLKVLDVETVDDAGILDWDDSSIRVETVPGEGGLTKVDIKWADASGPFDHYRVYNIKVADSDETLADAEAAAPTFDATWYTDQNGLDEYEVVSAEDSFYRANNLESYAYYKTSVVV